MIDKLTETNARRENRDRTTIITTLGIILLFIVFTFLVGLKIGPPLFELIGKSLLFVFAWIHGTRRYGIRNMLIWFAITWVVSNFFESLSIATGFPFGNYHYEVPGPRIVNVPIMVMPQYFGMGYIAWTLAQVLTRQFNNKPQGLHKFLIPLFAAFIMTAYDVAMDPISSTVNSRWIWHDGGDYFGVPLTNFAGWLLTVYCFLQLFALFLSRIEKPATGSGLLHQSFYWMQAVILYFFMGLLPILLYISHTEQARLFGSMALVSFFTVILIALLASAAIKESKGLIESYSL